MPNRQNKDQQDTRDSLGASLMHVKEDVEILRFSESDRPPLDHPRRPWQARVHEQIRQRLNSLDVQKNLIVSATGTGKTLVMIDIVWECLYHGLSVLLLTHRKLLFEQMSGQLSDGGVSHDLIAAGYPHDNRHQVNLAMIKSMDNFQRKGEKFVEPDVIIVDEVHVAGASSLKRCKKLWDEGGLTFSLTATPVGCQEFCEEGGMIEGCSTAEGRECGALLPAITYAPTHPGLKWVTKVPEIVKTPEGKEAIKTRLKHDGKLEQIWNQSICGRVIEHYEKTNPDHKAAVLFASSVGGAQFYAEKFDAEYGVGHSAMIAGDRIYYDGRSMPSTQKNRDKMFSLTDEGVIKLLTCRYVLRIGWDLPAIYQAILATPIGSIQAYVQSVGRVLRNHHSMDHVVIVDHGGSYIKYGSANTSWDWNLEWDSQRYVAERAEKLRKANAERDEYDPFDEPLESAPPVEQEAKEREPITCQYCFAIRATGRTCPSCGSCQNKSVRVVVDDNGELFRMEGDYYKPRRRAAKNDDFMRDWKSTYFRAFRANMTFRQAEALYARDHGWRYPPVDAPFMPVNESDMFSKVKDVPKSALHGWDEAMQEVST